MKGPRPPSWFRTKIRLEEEQIKAQSAKLKIERADSTAQPGDLQMALKQREEVSYVFRKSFVTEG
jgi:hypothetical protein